jgi:hypothetical protein
VSLKSNLSFINERPTKAVIWSWPTISCILPYTLVCFVQVIFDEVYSLWAVTKPADGGLDFKPKDIGLSLSFLGLAALAIQLLVYHRIQGKYGSLLCYRWAIFSYGLVFLLLPNLSWISVRVDAGELSRTWIWVTLLAVLFVRINAGVFAFTSGMLFVSVSCIWTV